ncbi:hypothetical protein JCGZ_22924 [Jatropha curcas]|uniref:Bifunctional inhibitor/plant lipid transfer protein/seed storage helical domain-containing protein n=1 Tax=Jatropha curcas TaxID=180498 RepID=A0A067LI82_JATCU|nr:non-specific lipid-transfer protein-like protein At2g13820 [Jatropha curcas]XP_037492395.1 non-specific lipid-transfer protein-like protein At2g13820 [Jatropha curcas]KDP44295.1 hypothetical protein JCGZ_22924 [Jatropha curcas]
MDCKCYFNFLILIITFSSLVLVGFSHAQNSEEISRLYGRGIYRGINVYSEEGETKKKQDTACVTKLLPCEKYLSDPTGVPGTCCQPLKNLVINEAECLCGVITNPGIMKTFNFTEEQAVNLAVTCGAKPNLALCKNATSPISAPSPSPPSPPSPPSNSANNGTSKTAHPPSESEKTTGAAQIQKSSGFIALFVAFLSLALSA